MALTWIAVDGQLAHRKVVYRVVELLRASGGASAGLSVDVPRDFLRTSAVGLLVGLWTGVGMNCNDGDISDVPDSLIEHWAGWYGQPGHFAQWVRDTHVSKGRIKDWDEMNGSLETRREKDRERKRLEREAQRLNMSRGASSGPSTGQAQDSPRDVRVTGAPTNQPTNQPSKNASPRGGAPAPAHPPAPARDDAQAITPAEAIANFPTLATATLDPVAGTQCVDLVERLWRKFDAIDDGARLHIVAEISGALEGMHGATRTWPELATSISDYLVNRREPSPLRLRTYLYRDPKPLPPARSKNGTHADESFTEARTRRARENASTVWKAAHGSNGAKP